MEGSDRRELVSEPRRNPGAARPPCPKSTAGRPNQFQKAGWIKVYYVRIAFSILLFTFVYIYLTFIN